LQNLVDRLLSGSLRPGWCGVHNGFR